jgi:HD superfamily phosphodiesterase
MKIDMNLVEIAAKHAESLLAPLGNRWRHVRGVVEKACSISWVFTEEDQLYLIVAAYLHDIGYAPLLKKTGFHPLDGANYVLQSFGNKRLASLVAYHSEAQFEAEIRGYDQALHEFPRERSAVADALTYCDMTTSSTGFNISFEERIADILHRYSDEDVISQAIRQATPSLSVDVECTEHMLY